MPSGVADKAAEIEGSGRHSWNGWRGDMHWLGVAAPGYTFGEPTGGHPPPACYTAEQSDTHQMCNKAIEYIGGTGATSQKPWAMLAEGESVIKCPSPERAQRHTRS